MKGEEKEEENVSEKIMSIRIKSLNLGSILFQALRPCHYYFKKKKHRTMPCIINIRLKEPWHNSTYPFSNKVSRNFLFAFFFPIIIV